MDLHYASLQIPMRVWQMAGLCSENVRQATIVSWMLLGVYFTREFLFKMQKISSPLCLGCNANVNETLEHLLLHCDHYQNIREGNLPRYLQENKNISEILDSEDSIVQCILDPLSTNLPVIVQTGWDSPKEAYSISRKFCSSLHRKREKLYNELDKVG